MSGPTFESYLRDFLLAMAAVTDMVRVIRQELRARVEVSGVNSAIEFVEVADRVALEVFVEAELANGDAVVWWLDAQPRNDEWTVEAEIRTQTRRGQDLLKSVHKATGIRPEDLSRAIADCSEKLRYSVGRTSFADIK